MAEAAVHIPGMKPKDSHTLSAVCYRQNRWIHDVWNRNARHARPR